MTFESILFRRAEERPREETLRPPEFSGDLCLDQVVGAITAGKEEYHLEPFFHRPLRDPDAVAFRHAVTRDLEGAPLLDGVRAFADSMRRMRTCLAEAGSLPHELQRQRSFLDAAETYSRAVIRLEADLARAGPTSRGLAGFTEYLRRHLSSEGFRSLRAQAESLAADLSAIRYTVLIQGRHVEVGRYVGEADYTAEVQATFEPFEQGAGGGFEFKVTDRPVMNHVETAILERVADLHGDVFSRLDSFVSAHQGFPDPLVASFDREVQFYVSYLEYLERFRSAGLSFCYPLLTRTSKEVFDYQAFDMALADKLIGEGAVPVPNDFHLAGRERIIVVSGPNQGGKTTFARMFGQLHYLGSLGLPVPGTRAQLFLWDRLFTHFEREETIHSLRGKLQDDLARVHRILEEASPDSVIIMNEIFTSTTFEDARGLSRRIARRILKLDLLCVWVTFLDELASLGPATVSMVSTVVPRNPNQRTYRILRQPADGLAYALSLAEKYHLTRPQIRQRLRS